MADIHIKIDAEEEAEGYVFELNARKTLDGDIIVRDHPDVDIIVMVEKKKVVAFPKESLSDEVYQTQDKLFDFLSKRGIISPESIQGGNLHGSMEGKILQNEKMNVINFSLMSVAKFVEQERPYFEYLDAFEKYQDDRLTDPSEADSTEFDPSRHSDTKGTMRPIYIRSPYGMSFTYRE
mgnify:FL=1